MAVWYFAGEQGVLGHHALAMEDQELAALPLHGDRLANEREGHRVAIALEADEVVLGDQARLPSLQGKAAVTAGGDEARRLALEAVAGALVGSAVDADIGDLGLPLRQLLGQIALVDEGAAGQEIAFEVPDARLHLPLRPGPVRSAEPGLEAPIVGEGLERHVPAAGEPPPPG
jgi:hypothetical protein